VLAPDRSFPRGSPVCDYWLSRCEGFTVRAGHRTLGVVEAVRRAEAPRAETIVLRKHRHHRTLQAGDVLAVVPARKVLLARRHQHAAPLARRTAEVVVPVARYAAAELWTFLCWAAAELRREVPRLTRLALGEIRDRNVNHGAEPGVGRAHRRANDYAFAQQPLGRGRNVGPTRTR
jgi:hypothetical protein